MLHLIEGWSFLLDLRLWSPNPQSIHFFYIGYIMWLLDSRHNMAKRSSFNSNFQNVNLEGKITFLKYKTYNSFKDPFCYKIISCITKESNQNLHKVTSFDVELTFGKLLTFWSNSLPKSNWFLKSTLVITPINLLSLCLQVLPWLVKTFPWSISPYLANFDQYHAKPRL